MARPRARILVVDDDALTRVGLRETLEARGDHVEQAASAAEALAALARDTPDLVLLDVGLPDGTGLAVLEELRRSAPHVPAVMITAHASIDGVVDAMRGGAIDYLRKPFEVEDLLRAVERALEDGLLRDELARRREEPLQAYRTEGLIAASPAMRELTRLIPRIAASAATTILLLGESGVGKGLVARALHSEGASSGQPFMHITCTALPEALLESELFGHERGAFTDARHQKRGLFELADGGTVFLDEIGDLSAPLQGKLLRFLEDKMFRRVGGSRDIRVAVRIIAATNKDLALEAEEGRFRRDLYYRLRVIPLEIPPLRERREDVEPLVRLFLRQFNRDFRKAVRGIRPDALEHLLAHTWPGNVRELRNAVERAVLLTDRPELEVADLPSEVRGAGGGARGEDPRRPFELPAGGLLLEQLEIDLLRQALRRAEGNRTRAAELLGMNRDQIRYRIRKYGLDDAAPTRGGAGPGGLGG